ncbi:protein of unknown function [Lachnospira pectinoschiza]|uniref:DUF4368 domain-containing protein n=2 Tax=Lachnospira pectinoschiza TaxID=28052 RepID=A0A1H0A3Z9_9FIRM|nr:protein of unknown function [Lachnospira pectinoschiza]
MTGERASYQKELDAGLKRLSELDMLLQKLYEDNAFGKISDERYASMSASFEKESQQLKSKTSELQDLLNGDAKQMKDAKQFASLVEKYTDITELTSELLHTLIDKVVVHEKEVEGDAIVMKVDIYYRFIGRVGNQEGDDLLAPKIRHRGRPKNEEEEVSA